MPKEAEQFSFLWSLVLAKVMGNSQVARMNPHSFSFFRDVGMYICAYYLVHDPGNTTIMSHCGFLLNATMKRNSSMCTQAYYTWCPKVAQKPHHITKYTKPMPSYKAHGWTICWFSNLQGTLNT